MQAAGMVIVGAGECGTRAAFALREMGYAGPVTLVGEEPHLPYERPPLSKEGLSAHGQAKPIAAAQAFTDHDITLVTSTEVRSIDRSAKAVRLANGSSLGYAKLLLATGARPRELLLAKGMSTCRYLRTLDDACVIARRLTPGARIVIVGGGFVGLELAAAATIRGCSVRVVEALPRLLSRAVPAEIADVVAAAHRAHGVEILTNASIVAMSEGRDGLRYALHDGAVGIADLCVVGIGALPETRLAERAGLSIENGIRVNGCLATDDPDVLAAGDCCSFPLPIYDGRRVRLEAWRNAQEQGAVAAANMLGVNTEHKAIPWFWSDQFDLSLQIAGLCDEGSTTVRRELDDGGFVLFHLDADGRLVAASGIGTGNSAARDIRVAQMLIERRVAPPADKLAAAETRLKSLLAA